MVGGATPATRGLEDEPELCLDPLLADELGQAARPKSTFDDRIVRVDLGIQRAVAAHERSRVRRAAFSRAPTSGRSPDVAMARDSGSMAPIA